MASISTIPVEIVHRILDLCFDRSPLVDVVHLRAVSSQSTGCTAVQNRSVADSCTEVFRDVFDTLAVQQTHFFGDRQAHTTWMCEPAERQYQQFYNLRGILSLQVTARLIEKEWDNDNFIDPGFRLVMQQVEHLLLQACHGSPEGMAGDLRRRLCNLLARTSRLHLEGRPVGQAFETYTSMCRDRHQRNTSRLHQCVFEDDNEQKCMQCDGKNLTVSLEDEAFAIAAAVSEPFTLRHLLEKCPTFCSVQKRFMLAITRKQRRPGWIPPTLENWSTSIENAAICGRHDNLKVLFHCLENYLTKGFQEGFVYRCLTSALQLAAENGHIEVVKFIKEFANQQYRGFDPENEDAIWDEEAYKSACINNHLMIAKYLEPIRVRENRLEPYDQDVMSIVLCSCMARGSRPAVLEYLVEIGAPLNVAAKCDLTRLFDLPLTLAINFGHRNLVQSLIRLGANTQELSLGMAYRWAVYWNDIAMLQLLDKNRSEAYHHNRHDNVRAYWELLYVACWRCSFDAADFVLMRSPEFLEDIRQVHKTVREACRHRCSTMVQLLLKHGVEFTGKTGAYAVFNSIAAGNKVLLELLLQHGADPNVAYRFEKRRAIIQHDPPYLTPAPIDQTFTPLEIARHQLARQSFGPDSKERYTAIFELLKKYGAIETS